MNWRSLFRPAARLLPSRWLITRGPSDRSAIALTFDDGPLDSTPGCLDVLDELGLRATFFVVGKEVQAHPDLCLEMVGRGHEVAGHGFTHSYFPALEYRALADELARTAELLPPQPFRPLVRPPAGAISPTSLWNTMRSGYTTVLWSLDCFDWRTQDASEIATELEQARAGDILLLHEGSAPTLEALRVAKAAWQRRGLDCVTLSDLCGL